MLDALMALSLSSPRFSDAPSRTAYHQGVAKGPVKVDMRLPGKGNSNTYGARPAHLIKWFRASRLSIKNSPSARGLGFRGSRRFRL